MRIGTTHHRTIELQQGATPVVRVIDQRQLPFKLAYYSISTSEQAAVAIKEMVVRGAPLIGVTAAFGIYVATLGAPADSFKASLTNAAELLKSARPTAVNLAWSVERMLTAIASAESIPHKQQIALATANAIMEEDVEQCKRIGAYGLELLKNISEKKNGAPVNILTHCNAGWLACVDYGTATAPIYMAHDAGIPVHVWVDETRPRNQGSRLTAYELGQHGIPHTIIVDNAGGHLMQHGMVDIAIVGCDRATANSDICNKIGTYLKALAAYDNGIPFYAAVPSSTFDFTLHNGITEIEIEERSGKEVATVEGLHGDDLLAVQVSPPGSPIANYGFDVTPARLVTGIITDRGICDATRERIATLFPETSASTEYPIP